MFHVIKIYSVLLLFFSYDTLNEVYHFSGFQICLLIKTASEGKSSFLAVSFKIFRAKRLACFRTKIQNNISCQSYIFQ